jgi:hypothetical protein
MQILDYKDNKPVERCPGKFHFTGTLLIQIVLLGSVAKYIASLPYIFLEYCLTLITL